MSRLSLTDIELSGRRVFMRVDFNVPLADGRITDDSRIRAALESIRYVVEHGGRLILASHLGRPKGKRVESDSLRPVFERLSELLEATPVFFAADCVGAETADRVAHLKAGEVLLLENLRFHAGEEANDPRFAKALADLADVYVNDAFGAAHRAHASTEGITACLPIAAAGFLMQKELEALGRALHPEERPYVAIVGGAKISGKIELMESFLGLADEILIGGAMAYTFLRASGEETGRSLVEADRVALAGRLLETARTKGRRIRLPVDHVVARDFDGTGLRTVSVQGTAPDEMGLDIGPETVGAYGRIVRDAKLIVWNGPMGVFENPKFASGTLEIGRMVAESDAFSIVGGGDSASAVNQAGLGARIDHVSTGGGAALEFLSGRKLPGVEALRDRPVGQAQS
jgi:phosphoglycerate kinase